MNQTNNNHEHRVTMLEDLKPLDKIAFSKGFNEIGYKVFLARSSLTQINKAPSGFAAIAKVWLYDQEEDKVYNRLYSTPGSKFKVLVSTPREM